MWLEDSVQDFNDETFQKCILKLKFRQKYSFKYNDVRLTKELMDSLGYHLLCYKKITALSKQYNEDFINFYKKYEVSITFYFSYDNHQCFQFIFYAYIWTL